METVRNALQEKVDEAIRLYNAILKANYCGAVIDADTILRDMLEESLGEDVGLDIGDGVRVLSSWYGSEDKRASEEMFELLTGIDFEDYVSRCVQETTRVEEKKS